MRVPLVVRYAPLAPLPQQHFFQGQADSRKQDNVSDVAGSDRRPRRDRPAFTVANQSDTARIDLFSCAQISDLCEGVFDEVRIGRFGKVPGRFADAAVVAAQHRDTLPGQVIGEHKKRPVIENRFIAILRA